MLRAPALCGFGEGCQWQALPSPAQCEETTTRTQDLPVTGGKTLPLAPGPPFSGYQFMFAQNLFLWTFRILSIWRYGRDNKLILTNKSSYYAAKKSLLCGKFVLLGYNMLSCVFLPHIVWSMQL